MTDLDPHAVFIIAAYAVTFLSLAALAFFIVEDDRRQRRDLADLETRGIRRRSAALILLVPILYVPATICFVLTNMRYTITVQPLMFVFVATALLCRIRELDAITAAVTRRLKRVRGG